MYSRIIRKANKYSFLIGYENEIKKYKKYIIIYLRRSRRGYEYVACCNGLGNIEYTKDIREILKRVEGRRSIYA